MSIYKQSESLVRYTMDCGFWRGLKWSGRRRLDVIGLQSCAVSYCNEHLTDGRLPRDLTDLAVALGLPERAVRKAVPLLMRPTADAPALWEDRGDHIQLLGYEDHNPTRAEVGEHREKKRAASVLGHHRRYHESRKITDPDCPHCCQADPPDRPPGTANSLPSGRPGGMPNSDQMACQDALREERRVEESRSSSSGSSVDPPQPWTGLDDDEEASQRFQTTARLVAEHRLRHRRPGSEPITNQARWLAVVAAQVLDEEAKVLVEMYAEGLDAEAMAARLCAGPAAEPSPYPPFGQVAEPVWDEATDDAGNVVALRRGTA